MVNSGVTVLPSVSSDSTIDSGMVMEKGISFDKSVMGYFEQDARVRSAMQSMGRNDDAFITVCY